jgi:hypothetical protein
MASITGFLKRLSVTELGFVTQGCLAMHVAKGPGPVYMGNLALKINVKVPGSATRSKQSRMLLVRIILFHAQKARSNRVVVRFYFPSALFSA